MSHTPLPKPNYGRRDTIDFTLQRLAERNGRTIVELGSIRSPGSIAGDGCSSLAWAWYAATHSGHLFTIDLDPHATAVTTTATAPYAPHVTALNLDGHAFLHDFPQPINLLYLDALDAFLPGSAEWHLTAFLLALPNLHPLSLVLIDDTDQPEPNKASLVIPYALARGWRIARRGRQQILLERAAGDQT